MKKIATVMVVAGIVVLGTPAVDGAATFDHNFAAYAAVLKQYVGATGVDYAFLKQNRGDLDRAVAELDSPAARGEAGWSREQRMAFWINAYNMLTLRAIVDHYPIQSPWFTLLPRNSIRQIDGVWTRLTWPVAGRPVTLDDIEHKILRPVFHDARVHFAINCASLSCPLLAGEPYRDQALNSQLDGAARRYLGSPEGLRIDGDTIRVSSILDWYGEDFVSRYAPLISGQRSAKDKAILGVITTHGAADAATRAARGNSKIVFLKYDWSLNDSGARR